MLEVLRNVPARLEQEAFGVPKWFELSMRFHFCLEINDFGLISVTCKFILHKFRLNMSLGADMSNICKFKYLQ